MEIDCVRLNANYTNKNYEDARVMNMGLATVYIFAYKVQLTVYEGQDYSVSQWTAILENWVKFMGATYMLVQPICEDIRYTSIVESDGKWKISSPVLYKID